MEKIVTKCGVALGTVSKHVSQLEDLIGKELVKKLHESAILRNEAGLTLSDDNAGARMVKLARDNGVNSDKTLELLEEFVYTMKSQDPKLEGPTAEQLADAAAAVCKIVREEGLDDVRKVPSSLQNWRKEVETAEKENERIQKQTEERKREDEKALKESGITQEWLPIFIGACELFGIKSVKNLPRLHDIVIHVARDYGEDPNRLVEDLRSRVSLRKQAENISQLVRAYREKQREYEEADDHDRLFLTLPLAAKKMLHSSLKAVSYKSGLPLKEVLFMFISDIHLHYTTIWGLQNRVRELKKQEMNGFSSLQTILAETAKAEARRKVAEMRRSRVNVEAKQAEDRRDRARTDASRLNDEIVIRKAELANINGEIQSAKTSSDLQKVKGQLASGVVFASGTVQIVSGTVTMHSSNCATCSGVAFLSSSAPVATTWTPNSGNTTHSDTTMHGTPAAAANASVGSGCGYTTGFLSGHTVSGTNSGV